MGEASLGRSLIEPVSRWLKEGNLPVLPIKDPWLVELDPRNPHRLIARSPLFVNPVLVEYWPEKNVLRLMVKTRIYVHKLQLDYRLLLYNKLLRTNKIPLVSAFIDDENDEVVFTVDLTTEALSKEEFGHGLTELLLYTLTLYEALKRDIGGPIRQIIEENVIEAVITLPELIRGLYREGVKKERLVDMLSVLMGREEAERIVTESLRDIEDGGDGVKEEKKGQSQSTTYL